MVTNSKNLTFVTIILGISTICFIAIISLTSLKPVHAAISGEEISAEEQMKQEENYVVQLVSQKTKQNLTTSDWKKCLTYLKDNYTFLMNETDIDKSKIKSYIEAYTLVEMDENMPDEKTNLIMEPSANYSPSKVTAYTNKYWDSHNSAYPYFNNADCANFVSQALKAGGKSMKGTVASDFSNWFCRTNSANQLSKISSTWRGADAFGHYWMSNAKKYKKFEQSYFSSNAKFKTVYNYGSTGDAISLLNANGRPYHTMIISYKEDGKLKCASHTSSHKWKSIYNYVNEYSVNGIRIYKM